MKENEELSKSCIKDSCNINDSNNIKINNPCIKDSCIEDPCDIKIKDPCNL